MVADRAASGIDYNRGATAFRRGRTLPPDILGAWGEAVSALRLAHSGYVLDLGSGTGQFLRPLAEWLHASVVGVEPSASMRAEAREVLVPNVTACVAGRAEALPLWDGTIDVAWLSTVVHQIDNLDLAMDELQRIIRPAGHVLIRGYFADLPVSRLYGHYPGIGRVLASFPSTAAITDRFGQHSFTALSVTPVREVWSFDLEAYVSRARELRHIDSAFRPLTDAEFAAGIASIQSDPAHSHGTVTNDFVLNLITLRRA